MTFNPQAGYSIAVYRYRVTFRAQPRLWNNLSEDLRLARSIRPDEPNNTHVQRERYISVV